MTDTPTPKPTEQDYELADKIVRMIAPELLGLTTPRQCTAEAIAADREEERNLHEIAEKSAWEQRDGLQELLDDSGTENAKLREECATLCRDRNDARNKVFEQGIEIDKLREALDPYVNPGRATHDFSGQDPREYGVFVTKEQKEFASAALKGTD